MPPPALHPSLRGGGVASSDAAVEIIPLGAGQEVGRSCIVVRYQGVTVLLDCGVHPGLSGEGCLPFFDEIDMSTVDAMLITHFHLDHSAAVPYVIARTPFRGRLLMTHATRAITHALLKDFARLGASRAAAGEGEALYSEKDLEAALARTELIDFDQTLDLGGFRVTALRAGHVLGAAMFEVEIAGLRVLYTGDYSRVPDRHMPSADLPRRPPHVLIVESTYGVSRHLPRAEREQRLTEKIHHTVSRGGRVLLPVVALGRAQELLLILDDYWQRHPELAGVPIYHASGLARRALGVYQAYIDAMSADIRAAFERRNPFAFRHVAHLRSARQLDDVGPCVVLASPSMLQSGTSRELFEAWCSDPANAVIIADFAVAGTLARDVLAGPAEVTARSGQRLPLRCHVDAISFSAHADFPQTSEFVDAAAPQHVVLVHGEQGEMARLKKALESRAAAQGVLDRVVYMPRVAQPVVIRRPPEVQVAVCGELAERVGGVRAKEDGASTLGVKPEPGTREEGGDLTGATPSSKPSSLPCAPPPPGRVVEGLLVSSQNERVAGRLVAREDLSAVSRLVPGHVRLKQRVALARPWSDARLALELLFDGCQGAGDLGFVEAVLDRGEAKGDGKDAGLDEADRSSATDAPTDAPRKPEHVLRLGGCVLLSHYPAPAGDAPAPPPHVVMEWDGGPAADAVADAAVVALLADAEEPAALSVHEAELASACRAGDEAARRRAERGVLAALLEAQFGPARWDEGQGLLVVDVEGQHAVVDVASGEVSAANEALAARVEAALARLWAALRPAESRAEAW